MSELPPEQQLEEDWAAPDDELISEYIDAEEQNLIVGMAGEALAKQRPDLYAVGRHFMREIAWATQPETPTATEDEDQRALANIQALAALAYLMAITLQEQNTKQEMADAGMEPGPEKLL